MLVLSSIGFGLLFIRFVRLDTRVLPFLQSNQRVLFVLLIIDVSIELPPYLLRFLELPECFGVFGILLIWRWHVPGLVIFQLDWHDWRWRNQIEFVRRVVISFAIAIPLLFHVSVTGMLFGTFRIRFDG